MSADHPEYAIKLWVDDPGEQWWMLQVAVVTGPKFVKTWQVSYRRYDLVSEPVPTWVVYVDWHQPPHATRYGTRREAIHEAHRQALAILRSLLRVDARKVIGTKPAAEE